MGLVFIFAYVLYLAQDLPSLDQLENYDPDLVTRIYSADGEILDELFLEKRIFVDLNQIPNNMKMRLLLQKIAGFIIIGASIREVSSVPLSSISSILGMSRDSVH